MLRRLLLAPMMLMAAAGIIGAVDAPAWFGRHDGGYPLRAVVRERIDAEVHQGVAASPNRLFAISDHRIDAIDRATGSIVASIENPTRYRHLNSCTVVGARLVCAHSNFPALPMRSSVEFFDSSTLRPTGSQPLGGTDGSLTWIVPYRGGWLACFANYDGRGGVPGRDHRATAIVLYGPDVDVERIYRLPDDVLARIAPRSMSGGGVGPDGLLYMTGHDWPEVYVMALPAHGDVLEHRATIGLPTYGQAIALDPSVPNRLWSIDRWAGQLVGSDLPRVATAGATTG